MHREELKNSDFKQTQLASLQVELGKANSNKASFRQIDLNQRATLVRNYIYVFKWARCWRKVFGMLEKKFSPRGFMAQKEFTILNDPCYPKISPHFLDSALQIVMVIVRLIVLSSYLISHKLTFSLSLFSSPLRNKFLKMYGLF